MALTRQDLLSLEEYSEKRSDFRKQVMQHKTARRFYIGESIAFYFESELTVKYQVQEMLRIEKIFDAEGIQEELDSYNPLIPDGNGWRATMMIEYVDPDVRKKRLAELKGVEETLWFGLDSEGKTRFIPTVNPDLERSNEDKTSAVHFVFFDFDDQQKQQILAASDWFIGIDHPQYGPLSKSIGDRLKVELAKEIIQ
ncbi:MAG: DUF3501 family protein [Enterobacterales bacterium]|nr:DUF3501 family protein [Enterobacterales bacterium]